MSLLKSYEGGRENHAHLVIKSLFEEYLSVEELFSDGIQVISCAHLNRLVKFKKNNSLLYN
jgi:hypothetical protein